MVDGAESVKIFVGGHKRVAGACQCRVTGCCRPVLAGECRTGVYGVGGVYVDFVVLVPCTGDSRYLIESDGIVEVFVYLFVTSQHGRKGAVAGS